MRRREVIAGLAAAGALGGGALVAFGNVDPLEDDERVEGVTLDTIDAPGSEAGAVTVPASGQPTYLEFFGTWCTSCASMVPVVSEVYDTYGDELQFLSVTNEPVGRTTTREDVADWWTEHGGHWTVALDADLELSTMLDVSGVPYTVVLDETNEIAYSKLGTKDTEELREQIERVI